MSITAARINAAIAKAGIPLEIVRGEGYQYFIYDDGKYFETVSVMVCWLKRYSVAEWVNQAGLVYIEIMERLKR